MSIIILENFKKNNRAYCKCQCECGKIFNARKDNIKSGHTSSCGCLSSRKGKNLLGKTFNHLTVVEKTNKVRKYLTDGLLDGITKEEFAAIEKATIKITANAEKLKK